VAHCRSLRWPVHDDASNSSCAPQKNLAPPASQRAGVAASVILVVWSQSHLASTIRPLAAARPLSGWPFPKQPRSSRDGARADYKYNHHQHNEASMPARRLEMTPISSSSPPQVPCHARPARTSSLASGQHPNRLSGDPAVPPRLAPSLRAPNARAPQSMTLHRCPIPAAPRL
jgi:hypothetical protein